MRAIMNTRYASTRRFRLAKVSLLAVAILAPFARGASSAERNYCLHATIDRKFMHPDGSVFPPGELKLRAVCGLQDRAIRT
jgi:hypothetical protein